MATPTSSNPGRTILILAAVIGLVFGLIYFAAPDELGDSKLTSSEKYRPRLGLDLEGGTSIILTPRVAQGQTGTITSDSLDRAVQIIRSRVDSFGVSEAEVTTAGDNIVISIPGKRDEQILDTVRRTAELRFRQVWLSGAPSPVQPAPTPTTSPSPSPSGTASPSPSSSPSTSNAGRVMPNALAQSGSSPSPSPTATPAPSIPADPATAITPELQKEFNELDCNDQATVREHLREPGVDNPNKPLVTCSEDGAEKYILGPAEVVGTDVKTASARLETNSQGQPTGGGWEVLLEFTGEGTKKFADVTRRLNALTGDPNRFGIVLDGGVVSAPSTNAVIPNGQAVITGQFTQEEARNLANVLKYGALPLTFDPGEVQEVSATLGSDQLKAGLIAGAIGLFLVVLYSLLYYRGLGLVTVASLAVAGIITYGVVVLLGWQIGFRLTLAGVAGLIVAIGITADSFIVYFERIRDEVRDGKTLRVAVESGWVRARRTILAADFVSLLGAVVLYVLSVGGVRGFAFTLGVSTVIDVVVVFLFTKPLVTILARTKFFGQGHPLSGLDPERLGAPRATLTTRPSTRRRTAGTTTTATSTTKEA